MTPLPLQAALWAACAQDWAELQEWVAQPLWEAMLEAAGVGAGSRLLDAGCGSGGAAWLAAERGALVTGLDLCAELLAIARDRLPQGRFVRGDLAALPFRDGSFDVVFAACSVECCQDPKTALAELRRVCSPSGRMTVGSSSPTPGAVPIDCPHRYTDPETYWLAQRSTGPVQLAIRRHGEAAVRRSTLAAAQAFLLPGGEVLVPLRLFLLSSY
jgi:ubiquinone/menaquinone biosynthesis C-methylase UbiE